MSRGTRQHYRRQARLAARKCLTVSEAWNINAQQRLPSDHPSLGLRKRAGKPFRPRMAEPLGSKPEQAWRYLRVIGRSPEAQALCKWLDDHPGPKSRCSGKVLLLGMCLAAEIVGHCRRSDVCSAINGLPATILFYLGLCDTTTFHPISYSVVDRQLLRLERAPFGEIMAATLGQKATLKTGPGADPGLVWLNQGMLLASVPQKVLEKSLPRRWTRPPSLRTRGSRTTASRRTLTRCSRTRSSTAHRCPTA